ncbi:MAG: S8 family serine peptidase [bacterium]|nr:S8 family serine peptidase [bacterium]
MTRLDRQILTSATCFLIFVLISVSAYSRMNSAAEQANPTLAPKQTAVKPLSTAVPSGTDISHVVVKFNDEAQVRQRSGQFKSLSGRSIDEADRLLTSFGSTKIRRLFDSQDEAFLDQQRSTLESKSGKQLADLNGYYRIDVTDPNEAASLINELNRLDIVEIAYFQPSPEISVDIAPPTPDYVANQDYREAAPAGVDADYANSLAGGDGAGVKIVDIEGGWQDTHEDLEKALGGLIFGTMIDDPGWRNHGTAVIGEMIAGDNGYGVTGISPGADIGMASIGSASTAEALYAAANHLQEGDVILIELHAPGPHYNFESRPDQLGYVCMEYWQANFDAIQYAWAKGVIVCEAAGNGSEDFDDFGLYGQLFDTTYRNSHAILIGAGYPWSSSSNLQKHGFSNYGERVNLQGYGSGVYSTGYGGLFDGGGDENQYYTSSFSGTSSASPIITGTVACLQGYYKATFGAPLTSDYARDILVAAGTPQLGDTSLHIGPRPNLAAAIPLLVAPASLYANPLMVSTSLNEGETADFDVWLINRSGSTTLDYSIVDNDSLGLKVADNWLLASPSAGTIPALDSALVTMTIDATVIPARIDPYKGVLEVSFGATAGPLYSTVLIPAFATVTCFDSTFEIASSDDMGGPVFDWKSAKDGGFKIDNGTFYNSQAGAPLDDGSAGPFTIGFNFNFYGTTYTTFWVGVNGALSFTESDVNVNGYFSSLDIPGAPFSTFVAPFWSDLIIDDALVPEAGIYIDKRSDTTIIEWYRPANFNQFGDTLTNFEIILTSDHNIIFQYNSVGTSGLENQVLVGLSELECKTVSYLDAADIPAHAISNSEAVRFDPNIGIWVQAGDVDGSGGFDIADITYLVDYLFGGGTPPVTVESSDVDCSGGLDITDLTYIVDYQFNGGPAPCSYWMNL